MIRYQRILVFAANTHFGFREKTSYLFERCLGERKKSTDDDVYLLTSFIENLAISNDAAAEYLF